ncbi:MAG: DNA polymerase III subunit beta [Bacteroidetes bacterium]|nr:MAG: DNA polymerase III subunit beta [Bacteroidota bacterium]REK00077.1 MAG: DNA polymerase III subunit beta [Bacteroidota bacterium]REK35919.1 MAG: DNA polymerase III subunit beta [Bacteroidota bacterium]REK50707.1 MAG: DNA polymerase III subunit beta [Bacteroidota bacterium]
MKFIVSSTTLLRHLQQISGVLNSNNPLPILDNFLFSVDKSGLTVSASDLETTMTTEVTLTDSKQSGKIAIPAKILLDTLKTFAETPLTFLIDEKTKAIDIASDYGKYKITGFDGDEFPKTPVMQGSKSFEVPAGVMLNAINKTLFATGNDELRPVMTGVFFQLSKDNITFVATDAHKLVRYRRNDLSGGSEGTFIVPKKPLNQLKNILASGEEKVKVSYTDNNAFFEFGNYSLICRLIDGRYPNYEAVIPTDNPNKLTIARKMLLESVRRVSLFANKTTHQVRLKMAGSELQVNAEDIDFASEASERRTCEYTGEDMEIGFNARFLSDMLSNLECEEINLEMSAPNRAGILTPAHPEDKAEEVLMLVMPVMLNN